MWSIGLLFTNSHNSSCRATALESSPISVMADIIKQSKSRRIELVVGAEDPAELCRQTDEAWQVYIIQRILNLYAKLSQMLVYLNGLVLKINWLMDIWLHIKAFNHQILLGETCSQGKPCMEMIFNIIKNYAMLRSIWGLINAKEVFLQLLYLLFPINKVCIILTKNQ